MQEVERYLFHSEDTIKKGRQGWSYFYPTSWSLNVGVFAPVDKMVASLLLKVL